MLFITSEWPFTEHPESGNFIMEQAFFLRKAGHTVDVFHFQGRKNPLRYILFWAKLRRKFRLSSYDVLHAHFGQSALLALPTPVPLLVTFHGSDLQGWFAKDGSYSRAGMLARWVSQQVARRATRVIIVSHRLSRFLPEKIEFNIIPCGIDLSLFQPISKYEARQRLNLPQQKRLVLFAANPERKVKRFPLAQAACKLIEGHFDLELVVLKDIPHQRVPDYLNACDVLLMTSMHEGSPTVIKEALACNLPVVSVDVGDVRERIAGIPGCVLCPDDDPHTIASGLAEVLSAEKRIAGRDAVTDLDWPLITQQIIAIYKETLSG